MDLPNTLILPTDDAALAVTMLNRMIHDQPHVVMVVQGKGPRTEAVVQMADKAVQSQRLFWALAWARDPSQIADVIADLKVDPSVTGSATGALVVTLSHGDVIKDVIPDRDPPPDMVRIWKSFALGAKE